MPQFDDIFADDEQLDEAEAIKQLRAAYKKQQKELREAQARLDEYHTQTREQELTKALTEAGLPAKVAKFVPADVVGGEALQGWLKEYGDVFGVKAPEPEAAPVEAGFYSQEEKDALGRISTPEATASAPGSPQDLADRILNATSEAELTQILRQS